MSHVIVVGGGAAGMLASIMAARNGNKVTLFEKNEKLGKKLYITGKGRCNITNASDMDVLFDNVMSNKKFLYSCFYTFTNTDMIDLLESLGLKTKVERGNRVFPQSDKSNDVIQTLHKEMLRLGVAIHFNSTVKELVTKEGAFAGVRLQHDKKVIAGDSVIIATGGLSYPVTGSTGDGLNLQKIWDIRSNHVLHL